MITDRQKYVNDANDLTLRIDPNRHYIIKHRKKEKFPLQFNQISGQGHGRFRGLKSLP